MVEAAAGATVTPAMTRAETAPMGGVGSSRRGDICRRGGTRRGYIVSFSNDEDKESVPSDSDDSGYAPSRGRSGGSYIVHEGCTTRARGNADVGPNLLNAQVVDPMMVVVPSGSHSERDLIRNSSVNGVNVEHPATCSRKCHN